MAWGPSQDAAHAVPALVIVADTSAWVEFFRRSGHPVASALRSLIERGAQVAITEVILMELLAGTAATETPRIRARLIAFPILRLEALDDYEQAALIYRRCRDSGHTLRSQQDCLVAVPAIRHGASLLHNDQDFDVIARHTELKLHVLAG